MPTRAVRRQSTTAKVICLHQSPAIPLQQSLNIPIQVKNKKTTTLKTIYEDDRGPKMNKTFNEIEEKTIKNLEKINKSLK